MTLRDAIEAGGRNLLAILSAEQDYLPFWAVSIDEDHTAVCESWWPTHNVGRWWDAVLRVEATTGLAVPAELEGAMLRNLERCLDNPLSVPCYLEPKEDPDMPAGWIDKHSQREILLALTGLVRRRNSEWAERAGAAMVRTLDDLVLPNGRWDDRRVAEITGLSVEGIDPAPGDRGPAEPRPAIWTHGRLIEPLVDFYHVTGDGAAVDLASRLAAFHYEHTVRADGTVPPRPTGRPSALVRYADPYLHTHSLLGIYRGLLTVGEATGQARYVEAVERTYRESVLAEVRESGFVSHDWGSEQRGDVASTADVAQLGLWLARRGHADLLDDVQRLVRARVLPAQLREPPELTPRDPASDADRYARLVERSRGAFAGIHRSPHGGTVPTTDVTAAILHALCGIYGGAVEATDGGLWVHLYVDYADDDVTLRTSYGERFETTVTPASATNVFLRVPGWATEVSVAAGDRRGAGTDVGDYRRVGAAAGERVTLTCPLPERTTRETIDGTEYEIGWAGDEIRGVDPVDDLLPFYEGR